MEQKKVSFGFSKISKRPNFLPVKVNKQENQIELIKCLEGHEIKLVAEQNEIAPIVIPMKEDGKTSAALASLIKRRAVLLGEEYEEGTTTNSNQKKLVSTKESSTDNASNENDLDKQAALEILADLKKDNETVHDSGLVLPVLKPDELPLDGAKESTMNDYESIPIEQYGLAMLRGMGWVEPPPSKQNKLAEEAPMVRPKGMGLGADKALKPKPLLVQPEANETLQIKKQAYVRILGGKFKDAYGQIEGFDDDAGRVIVKLAIGGTKETFNEFLCQPVCKKEFTQYGKCINTKKYEEYKQFENEHGQIIKRKEEPFKLNTEFKLEKDEKKIVKTENDDRQKPTLSRGNDGSNGEPSNRRYDDNVGSSSKNRARSKSRSISRSRSRSTSRSRKHISSRRYDHAKNNDDFSGSSTNESDADSVYERRHKHKKKSKSHAPKSKSSKKKSRHYGSIDESNDDKDHGRHREHSSSKKNKKKTKKSKKQRSRTPSRHRR